MPLRTVKGMGRQIGACFSVLCLLTCCFSARAAVDPAQPIEKNLLKNPSFEQELSGWQIYRGGFGISSDASHGRRSLHFHVAPGEVDSTAMTTPSLIPMKTKPRIADSTPRIPVIKGGVYELDFRIKRAFTRGVVQVLLVERGSHNSAVVLPRIVFKPGEEDWKRYTIRFTPSLYTVKMNVRFSALRVEGDFWCDDVVLKRIVPTRPAPMDPIKAVTFRGSPSRFGMTVEKALQKTSDLASVQTTGADFVFDLRNGTITCSQRLLAQRQVATLKFGSLLKGLKLVRHTPDVAVFRNDALSIGIQGDSLMMLYALRDIPVEVVSTLKTAYSKREGGYAIAFDPTGGFGIFPSAPVGTGLAYSKVRQTGDAAKPPWGISMTIRKGYRLGFSVSPPRPFPFVRSFNWHIMHSTAYPPDSALERWSKDTNLLTLHASPAPRSGIWDGTCPWVGPYRLSRTSAMKFRRVITTAQAFGMKVIPYFAPGMHPNPNLDDFLAEVAALKEEYGFDGVYYDGLYAGRGSDWTKSYELMRLTRDLVGPDNPVYIHTTLAPPLGSQSYGRIFCPFIDTYADFQLRGEHVRLTGLEDPYIRYNTSGYGTSSVIGLLKLSRAHKIKDMMQYHFKMLSLHGRMRRSGFSNKKTGVYPGENGPITDSWGTRYLPALKEMEKQYRQHK